MAVPAEDERDFAFAQVHGLPIVRTVEPPADHEGPYAGDGPHINSGLLNGLDVAAAKEVAAEGIRVNAVRPGLIETEIHASGGLPNRVKDLQHLVPMQRGGSAEEVAQSIVWLLSDAASYTTGTCLNVDGGYLLA